MDGACAAVVVDASPLVNCANNPPPSGELPRLSTSTITTNASMAVEIGLSFGIYPIAPISRIDTTQKMKFCWPVKSFFKSENRPGPFGPSSAVLRTPEIRSTAPIMSKTKSMSNSYHRKVFWKLSSHSDKHNKPDQ